VIEGSGFTEVKLMRRTCDDWSEQRRECFEGFALRCKMASLNAELHADALKRSYA
jgi:hypothetical protein